MRGTLPLEDLGFTTADFTEVRELWMDRSDYGGDSLGSHTMFLLRTHGVFLFHQKQSFWY